MHGPRQGCHSECAPRLDMPPKRCGLGFSETRREPPENERVAQGKWWGYRSGERLGSGALTISAFNFPQFTQMHSRIFFTLTRKPEKSANSNQYCGAPSASKSSIRTNVKNGPGKFDMPKMPRALSHTLTACLALEVAVDCSQTRIHQPRRLYLPRTLLQHLREFDFAY